ncbi:PIN-like domain-containing protein [Nucisporomicrobium flavum]|uniref:PIN-like domain-containing protein n=1 Tax=Nucisporomicrobium flavum TaxID=2785915 RepID=UPI0018F6F892|nr:PIN-like domain-containing protein [Nucisporomicrobium flavum]
MPKGFSEDFAHLIIPSESSTAEAVTSSLVVVDTNVLLDLYRFASNTREELLQALRKLGNRLWIPHQVALEFHLNRIGVISGHDSAYVDAVKSLEDAKKRLLDVLSQASSRVALPQDEVKRLTDFVEDGLNGAADRLQKLRQLHGIPADSIKNDPILKQLQTLFDGRVGDALPESELEDAQKEAQRRIDEGVPPGFKDKGKAEPYGDYLLWHQTLKEVDSRRLPLLIVTRDTKEDWFWRHDNQTVGARTELVRECLDITGMTLTMMSTKTFLFHARSQLRADVSDSTLRQVEILPGVEEPVSGERGSNRRELQLTPSLMAELSVLARSFAEELNRTGDRLARQREQIASRAAMSEGATPEERDELEALDADIEQVSQRISDLRVASFLMEEESHKRGGDRIFWKPVMSRAMDILDSSRMLGRISALL